MTSVTPRSPFFVLAIISFWLLLITASANSFAGDIDNVIGQIEGAEVPEFLDPDEAFVLSVDVDSGNRITAHWDIAEGYYLYQDKFGFSFENENNSGDANVTIVDVQLPEGKLKHDPDFGDVIAYFHSVDALLTLQNQSVNETNKTLLVKYQGCKEDVLCYPPIEKLVPVKLTASTTSSVQATAQEKISEQDKITERLSDDSFIQNVLIFFGFGLLLALTPCVFPMIPILSGIIVRQGTNITTLRSFYMSLTYVVAMALTYAVLGIIAGSFSFNLQAASQNIWVISAFSGVFVLLALSMFGFYEIQLPSSWQSKLSEKSQGLGGTLSGVAAMGVLSAIIVGPCVAPPLAGALLYITQTNDAVLGGFALFAMGMGMGVPLLVIGTSAGKFLPKAGSWMETIKYIFGVLMLAVAIWFMERVLPGPVTLMLWAVLLIVSAIYMGALDRSTDSQSKWRGLWRGLGLAMLVYGFVLIVGAASGGSNALRPLENLNMQSGSSVQASKKLPFQMIKSLDDLQAALERAKQQDKYVMLDFYADWCIVCKEMEHETFSDPLVHASLKEVILLKADVTENDDVDAALLKAFDLYGPPAILFFNKESEEEKAYRVVGFMDAVSFIKHISEVISD